MFVNRIFLGVVIIAFYFVACSPSQPAKTNVLSKANTSSKPPQNNKGNTQTVFVKPESKKEQPKQPPKKEEPQIVKPTIAISETAPEPLVKTPEYYRGRANDLQPVAKPLYRKITDSLLNIMSKSPDQTKNPAVNAEEWYASPNFNIRKPNYVVLHHTAQNSVDQTLFTFSLSRTSVSAHYVVGRDGTIYQMLNDYMRAWHAGNGKWGSITDMNSVSLGIEIDNNGNEPFGDAQIDSLIVLLKNIKNTYGIPQANFVAHSDIAPGRKKDPSKYFPWKKLADAGFGYWYDSLSLMTPPPDFNALLALRVIGYDIKNVEEAVGAFKLHYIQTDTTPSLTEYDKKVLYNIYRKF